MRDERQIRSFSRQFDHYRITVSHEASRVHIKTFNCESNEVQEQLFCNLNLPETIKREHETVDDLYDYLRDNSSIDFQIQHDFVRYKDVKHGISNWFSLPLTENTDESQKQIENDKNMDQQSINQSQSSSVAMRSNWADEKRRLVNENTNLKKQIARLKIKQKERKQFEKKNMFKQRQPANYYKKSFFVNQESNSNEKLEFLMEDSDFYSQMPLPVDIKLTVNKKCTGFQQYKMMDNRITKTTQNPAILTFKETINRNQSKRFAIKIETELINNWIIVGLLRKQLINRQFCYFIKNSIAYSGSMGIIFVDHEVLDIGVVAGRGDLLQIVVHNKLHVIEWIMNRQLICSHKIPVSLLEHKLFPFIMLAHSRDSVSVNIPSQ